MYLCMGHRYKCCTYRPALRGTHKISTDSLWVTTDPVMTQDLEDRRWLKAAELLQGLMALNLLLQLSPLGLRLNSDSCLLYWSSFIAISLFSKDGKKLFQDSSLKWALVLMWIFTHSFLVYTLSSLSLYRLFLYWERAHMHCLAQKP